MPIRWYGPANPSDPTYQHFERVVNLTLHAGVFAAVNSGVWFVQGIRHPWSGLSWFTSAWFLALLIHLTTVVIRRPSLKDRITDG